MENKGKKILLTKIQNLPQIKITSEDITKYFCPLATEKEIYMALGIIKSLNLNPFAKEVHLIKYTKDAPISIVVGYEVYLKRAERTGLLNGWETGITDDGKKAWIKIYRKDWAKEFYWEVELSEFSKNQATWKQIPTFMGKKVVIAQGFRLAFPELGGLPYTPEEHAVFNINTEIIPHKPVIEMPKAIKEEKTIETEKKPETELTVNEALNQPINTTAFNMFGQLFNWKECKTTKKDKNGNDIYYTNYFLSPLDSTNPTICVTKFGKAHEGIKIGNTISLQHVDVVLYQNEKQYLAREIAILNIPKTTEKEINNE